MQINQRELGGLKSNIKNLKNDKRIIFIKRYEDILDNNSLIIALLKIEDFEYINIHLDKESSRRVQKEFAKKILNLVPKSCDFFKIYILDNGRFALIKDYHNSKKEIEKSIKNIKIFQKKINSKKINIEPIDYDLSIVVSFAYGSEALKNAQIGLKMLNQTKEDFIVANHLLKQKQSIAVEKIKTFKMVKQAIDSYNIVSYFQPIVNNKTQKIEKYESLVRLIDKDQNIISPNQFLDTAKEGKYYSQITSMVLVNSFEALYQTDMNISINFSSLDIERSSTQLKFFELLREHKQHAPRIILELLEDERITNIDNMKKFINRVKKFGVQIAIDDFGTGYSNFKRVLEYKPDILKIDGSLIQHITDDDFSRHMVETIVAFSKKQNIKTVAEFVKSEAIFKVVCQLGVDFSQGYYFGKPDLLK